MKHRVGLDGAARNLGFLSIVCQHRKSCRQFVVLILCGHWLVSSVLAMAVVAPPSTRLVSNCACGRVYLMVPMHAITHETLAADCHCPQCRRYHTTAFVSYLVVPRQEVTISGPVGLFRDRCSEVGDVDRIYCTHCASKVATQPINGDCDSLLINMGPLVDASIPPSLAACWRFYRKQWHESSRVSWGAASPDYEDDLDDDADVNAVSPYRSRHVVGGCRCGHCMYELEFEVPTELQHCYCRLCRQFSGGPFMTWMPVWDDEMQWTTRITEGGFAGARRYGPPDLQRTTPHGRRHVCPQCQSVMTIVYQSQHGVCWPAVGGYDDDSIPSNSMEMNSVLGRVLHICCNYKQTWYAIPQDGLPRLGEAS